MDQRQELLRAVFGIVREELQGGFPVRGGGGSPRERRQEALLRMLQSDQQPVQWIAMKELGQIGDEAAAEAMMPFATHPNKDLSDTARTAIRQIQERELRSPVAAAPPPPPPPPPPVRPEGANSPLSPIPPPPPPVRGVVVEAHMGRERGQRLTKGFDLPTPPTEMELRRGQGATPEKAAVAPGEAVVEAHMGRDRGQRLTKGQDLPVPPTETELQEIDMQARPTAAFAETGTVGLPPLAPMPEPIVAMPDMASQQLEQPAIPSVPPMAEADRDHPFPGM
ncbi:MAG: HEAT repeat domain-containing protein [Bacteroidota bacterium]